MEFDLRFQRDVLGLMMHNDVFGMRALEHLQPGFFQSEALGWMFKLYHSHWQEWTQRLSPTVVFHEWRKLPADKQRLFEQEVMHVMQGDLVLNAGYIQAQLKEFVSMNIFVEAHRQSAKMFEAGHRDDSYRVMREANERISQITFEQPARQWFFEELEERQRSRVMRLNDPLRVPRTTGLPELDQRCGEGVQDGEVWAVLAYSKRCKSTWLHNQGFFSTRIHRLPTLHIVLEGLETDIADRYDACFSRELYARVKRGEINAEAYYHLQNDYAKLRKKLVIRCYNDWQITMDHIVAELAALKGQGFEPRTLIVDYVDCLRSRDPKCNGETQHQLDATRDLKRLTNDRGYATWTAFQAQRPVKGSQSKKHYLTSSNVADAYAKCRVVDSFGSLNATDEEMANNEMRVYWEAHRSAPMGIPYRITNELATMRMLETSEQIDFEESMVA